MRLTDLLHRFLPEKDGTFCVTVTPDELRRAWDRFTEDLEGERCYENELVQALKDVDEARRLNLANVDRLEAQVAELTEREGAAAAAMVPLFDEGGKLDCSDYQARRALVRVHDALSHPKPPGSLAFTDQEESQPWAGTDAD